MCLTVIRPVTTASPKRTLTVRTFETVAPLPGVVPSTGAWARAGAAVTPVARTAPSAATRRMLRADMSDGSLIACGGGRDGAGDRAAARRSVRAAAYAVAGVGRPPSSRRRRVEASATPPKTKPRTPIASAAIVRPFAPSSCDVAAAAGRCRRRSPRAAGVGAGRRRGALRGRGGHGHLRRGRVRARCADPAHDLAVAVGLERLEGELVARLARGSGPRSGSPGTDRA